MDTGLSKSTKCTLCNGVNFFFGLKFWTKFFFGLKFVLAIVDSIFNKKMGVNFFPGLKFVLAIVDEIFNKKYGGQFFFGKKTKPGVGGPREVGKRPYFSRIFFFLNPSLIF